MTQNGEGGTERGKKRRKSGGRRWLSRTARGDGVAITGRRAEGRWGVKGQQTVDQVRDGGEKKDVLEAEAPFSAAPFRFSFRRVLFGFVCSGWTGASAFLQLQQLCSGRRGGTQGPRGPLPAPDVQRTPRSCWWRGGLPPRPPARGGPTRTPGARRSLQFPPRGWRRARAAKGWGNREASRKETEKDLTAPEAGREGRAVTREPGGVPEPRPFPE